MICHAFPPTGGPGVQRSAKFAKYLPQFGWRPFVWSADHLDQLPYDQGLTADLPEDLVRYTTPAWSYSVSHRRIMRALRAVGVARWLTEGQVDGLDWRVLRFLQGLSARMVPDDQCAWVLRSVRPLLELVRRENIDAVFSTYSPVANHLLGLLIQRVAGVPWAADFRDLWTDDYGYSNRGRPRRWIERRIEHMILRRADAVVAVTPSQARILARHVPGDVDKFICITNGVDRDDFARVDQGSARGPLRGPAGRFVLTFVGRFLSDRVDAGLIDGLGRFARIGSTQEKRFEFRVVGTVSAAMLRRFREAGTPVTATGYVPHRDAVRHLLDADVLLLPAPSGPNADTLMPAKVFEYLASGRPILLVGPPDGEVQRLVRECEAGVCVASRADAVCAAITGFWEAWRRGRLPRGCMPERLAPFTRRALTARLAHVLDDLCQHAPHGVAPRRR